MKKKQWKKPKLRKMSLNLTKNGPNSLPIDGLGSELGGPAS